VTTKPIKAYRLISISKWSHIAVNSVSYSRLTITLFTVVDRMSTILL